LMKMLLLSGQRREKVATMEWDDLIEGGREWRIASKDREKGNAGKLKLSPMALDIIEAQRDRRIANNPFVFAAGQGSGPFNSFSQRKAELDKKLLDLGWSKLDRTRQKDGKVMDEEWVIHDLRRTCRALMTRAKVPTDVAEFALGHSIKGIQATYDNPDEYKPAIDRALACVAAEIGKIISPPPVTGNVVPLR